MNNKKLLIINIIILTTFIVVVGLGLNQSKYKKADRTDEELADERVEVGAQIFMEEIVLKQSILKPKYLIEILESDEEKELMELWDIDASDEEDLMNQHDEGDLTDNTLNINDNYGVGDTTVDDTTKTSSEANKKDSSSTTKSNSTNKNDITNKNNSINEDSDTIEDNSTDAEEEVVEEDSNETEEDSNTSDDSDKKDDLGLENEQNDSESNN